MFVYIYYNFNKKTRSARKFRFVYISFILAKDLNASKRSSIAEHLVNNLTCANKCNINRSKIIKICSNVFDLIRLKVICILLRKSILWKYKEFNYTVFYFRNIYKEYFCFTYV